jgi:hypothetical protein
MKKWYQSKMVWLGIITTLIGALGLVSDLLGKPTVSPQDITLLLSGILGIVLRVWFTTQPVER